MGYVYLIIYNIDMYVTFVASGPRHAGAVCR